MCANLQQRYVIMNYVIALGSNTTVQTTGLRHRLQSLTAGMLIPGMAKAACTVHYDPARAVTSGRQLGLTCGQRSYKNRCARGSLGMN